MNFTDIETNERKGWHIRQATGARAYWSKLTGGWNTFSNAQFFGLLEAARIIEFEGLDAVVVEADTAWNQEAERYGFGAR